MTREEKSIAIAKSVMNTARLMTGSLQSVPKLNIRGKARRNYGRLIRKTAKRNQAFAALYAVLGAAELYRIASTPIPKFQKGGV